MWNRNTRPVAFVCAAAILLCAAAHASEEATGAGSGSPFAWRIGWMHECLAIENQTLQPGTPVTIIVFAIDDESIVEGTNLPRRAAGKILGKTDSDEHCPPLFSDRRGINEGEEVSFYAVALEGGRTLAFDEFGIGILGLDAEDTDPIDLDGNGASESFSICTSSEGINFAVWKDLPYTGRPLWKGYYYLFHGVANPDCPEGLVL